MTIHSAFNGQVQFDCTPPNLKSIVVKEGLERAVPEWVTFPTDSSVYVLFTNLVEFLGKTKSITFIDIGLSEDAEGLQTFWKFASKSMDYRAIWNEFMLLTVDVNTEWFNAVSAVIDPRLLAPAEVQPGAPSDEALEATGTDGAKKKKRATST